MLIWLHLLLKSLLELIFCFELLANSPVHSYCLLFDVLNYVLRHLLLIQNNVIILINCLWHWNITHFRILLRAH